MVIMAAIDGNTHHNSTVASTLINCHSILLPTETPGRFYKECTRNGWGSANIPRTTYIKLLRDSKKRKQKIKAEPKQMAN
jgi:hypothetical protein